MGWRELTAWQREMRRTLDARANGERADPETWSGIDQDPWWQEMRAKREQERAR